MDSSHVLCHFAFTKEIFHLGDKRFLVSKNKLGAKNTIDQVVPICERRYIFLIVICTNYRLAGTSEININAIPRISGFSFEPDKFNITREIWQVATCRVLFPH